MYDNKVFFIRLLFSIHRNHVRFSDRHCQCPPIFSVPDFFLSVRLRIVTVLRSLVVTTTLIRISLVFGLRPITLPPWIYLSWRRAIIVPLLWDHLIPNLLVVSVLSFLLSFFLNTLCYTNAPDFRSISVAPNSRHTRNTDKSTLQCRVYPVVCCSREKLWFKLDTCFADTIGYFNDLLNRFIPPVIIRNMHHIP